MAYQVNFTVPERPIQNKDIEFDVKKDKAMLGTLKVSKGGIVWRPKDSKYGYFCRWSKFDEIISHVCKTKKAL